MLTRPPWSNSSKEVKDWCLRALRHHTAARSASDLRALLSSVAFKARQSCSFNHRSTCVVLLSELILLGQAPHAVAVKVYSNLFEPMPFTMKNRAYVRVAVARGPDGGRSNRTLRQ